MEKINLHKTMLDEVLSNLLKKETYVRCNYVSMIPFEADYSRQGQLIKINMIKTIGLLFMLSMLYIKYTGGILK